ncbi:MAG: P-loop NTPase fold protein [Eubacteriales bacterium]
MNNSNSYSNEEISFLELIDNKEDYMVLENESFVVFLNSNWGTGKTTFIQNIKNKVEKGVKYNEKKYDMEFIYYDAWEYDDWSEPVSPLINCLKNNFDGIDDEVNQYIDAIISVGVRKGLNLLMELLMEISENKVGISKKTFRKAIRIGKDVNEEVKAKERLKYSEEFEEYLSKKKSFLDYLKRKTKNKNIVFVIDELDRCKPNFAIETLEFIKHYFNECDVTFVFVTDIVQLGESICSVYGNINYDIYLSKFYDYKYEFQQILIEDYIRNKMGELSYDYNILGDIPCDKYIEQIVVYSKLFMVSYREIHKILKAIVNTLHKMSLNVNDFESVNHITGITLLIFLKQLDIHSYYKLLSGQYERSTDDGLPVFLREKYPSLKRINGVIPCSRIDSLLGIIKRSNTTEISVDYKLIMKCLDN